MLRKALSILVLSSILAITSPLLASENKLRFERLLKVFNSDATSSKIVFLSWPDIEEFKRGLLQRYTDARYANR